MAAQSDMGLADAEQGSLAGPNPVLFQDSAEEADNPAKSKTLLIHISDMLIYLHG